MTNRIDHIAFGADTLAHGNAAMQSLLGVKLPSGGKHDQMGTHNCLVQSGNSTYIELIAVDPDAPQPGRPRWFTLDSAATKARLKERPRALSWVVNTTDLNSVIKNSPVDLGEVLDLSRGDRRWKLTVPRDGSLAEQGLIPAFIEWPPGPHASNGMDDVGIQLQSVNLGHPDPDELEALLAKLGIAELATVYKNDARALSFTLITPSGATVTID